MPTEKMKRMPRRIEADVALRVVDVSIARRRSSARVVEGVSFVLEHGHTLAVMGATGSGKSSLAAVLAGADTGALSIVGGSAEVDGMRVRRYRRQQRRLTYVTGYLSQTDGATLPSRLTVSEVVGEPITSRDRRVNSQALSARVAALLDELQLPLGIAAKYPYELSAGMRQRVALARALILEPRIFIGDEPFANLDIEARPYARDALLRRRDELGMSLLLVTNDADAVGELDADVLVLRGGHPVAYGHGTSDLLWTPDEERRIAS